MITLEPMSDELFVSYIEEAVAHFSKEYVIAGICAERDAVAMCRSTYEKSLPQGVSTPGNYLYELRKVNGQVPIGMAWLAIWVNSGKRSAFICDVYVRPEWRSQGYGTQAMRLLRKLGFQPTGINMIKHLDAE